MSAQLQLLPDAPPSQALERITLDRLEGFEHANPSRELREQLAALGLLQPIIAVPVPDGRYRIVDGRRRAKAIEQLAGEGRWVAPPTVDTLVLGGASATRRGVGAGLTLAMHASRSASLASELAAIEAILSTAGEQDQALTVKEIAAQTGMSVQTVRRRLRLRSLSGELRRALDHGEITATIAEAAARLSAGQQAELERRLAAGERLTLAAIREVAREQVHAATAELPDALFAERDGAWQTTVLGHLTAAIAAVPDEHRDGALARALADAVACTERM